MVDHRRQDRTAAPEPECRRHRARFLAAHAAVVDQARRHLAQAQVQAQAEHGEQSDRYTSIRPALVRALAAAAVEAGCRLVLQHPRIVPVLVGAVADPDRWRRHPARVLVDRDVGADSYRFRPVPVLVLADVDASAGEGWPARMRT